MIPSLNGRCVHCDFQNRKTTIKTSLKNSIITNIRYIINVFFKKKIALFVYITWSTFIFFFFFLEICCELWCFVVSQTLFKPCLLQLMIPIEISCLVNTLRLNLSIILNKMSIFQTYFHISYQKSLKISVNQYWNWWDEGEINKLTKSIRIF